LVYYYSWFASLSFDVVRTFILAHLKPFVEWGGPFH
jgi:hypothetical protein